MRWEATSASLGHGEMQAVCQTAIPSRLTASAAVTRKTVVKVTDNCPANASICLRPSVSYSRPNSLVSRGSDLRVLRYVTFGSIGELREAERGLLSFEATRCSALQAR